MGNKVLLFIACLAFALVGSLGSSIAWANLPVVFEDNFDDGNIDGWSGWHPVDGPRPLPDVNPSPEGYAVWGVGSGGGSDPGLSVFITHPVSFDATGGLKIEMRAKSGSQSPNVAQLHLWSGYDIYAVYDWGEGNKRADWVAVVDGVEGSYRHSIGNMAYEWHDYAWTRDAAGWWSLSIDEGLVDVPNFYQDSQLNTFDNVSIHVLRDQSAIEWVRISAIPEPSSLVLLLTLGTLAIRRRR